ncbi:hypothetical protein QR680_001395 [Steinernema hermaphroditum]|uniref:Transmembrane and coiled-coil domain-containing protein 4 n=1 Tax=Steinernema hermaphroditum TaxID=289476 RepID=A0AA39GZ01_9BILA|nr:hypothetical protein QR680_001395 [Steinernema hermaphroditum]
MAVPSSVADNVEGGLPSRPSFPQLPVFPSRQGSRSSNGSNSSTDVSPQHRSILAAASRFSGNSEAATRYAFVELICTILRLDFYDSEDSYSLAFCELVLETVLAKVDLPRRTKVSVRHHLKGEGTSDDIVSLITTIKANAYIAERGSMHLLAMLVLISIERGEYDSRFRVMLRHASALLGSSWDEFEELEDGLTHHLLDDQYVESEHSTGSDFDSESRKSREKAEKMKKVKRYAMIGAATGVGGVIIGLTGGLAAPLVAAGAGVVIGAGAAAGIATTAGAAVLGSVFGVAGAGLAGYKMNKRVGAIEEFVVEPLTEGHSLHCILCVSGWIDENSPNAFQYQWRHLWMSKEQYTLRYESKYLVELGKAIDYIVSFAVSYAVQHTLMETALAGLVAAVAWPVALLSASSVLDNPWNVCVTRAAEVGEQLAEVLLSRAHGKRPITLVGFSLGARVIYHCLLAMSKRSECRGIIQDVVLLGAPVSASPKEWKKLCSVVGGRVINGYCETDWLLRFVYRTMSVQFAIAGTGPVEARGEKKIVNFNLSNIVKGHLDYARKLTEILDAVDLEAYEQQTTVQEGENGSS